MAAANRVFAWEGTDRSGKKTKGEINETVTVTSLRRCPACQNEPTKRANCPTCEGKGAAPQTTVTKKTKHQAGDPAYLRIMKDCISEITAVEGLKNHDINISRKAATRTCTSFCAGTTVCTKGG